MGKAVLFMRKALVVALLYTYGSNTCVSQPPSPPTPQDLSKPLKPCLRQKPPQRFPSLVEITDLPPPPLSFTKTWLARMLAAGTCSLMRVDASDPLTPSLFSTGEWLKHLQPIRPAATRLPTQQIEKELRLITDGVICYLATLLLAQEDDSHLSALVSENQNLVDPLHELMHYLSLLLEANPFTSETVLRAYSHIRTFLETVSALPQTPMVSRVAQTLVAPLLLIHLENRGPAPVASANDEASENTPTNTQNPNEIPITPEEGTIDPAPTQHFCTLDRQVNDYK